MGKHGKVLVDLSPVIATLEGLAEDVEKIQESGLIFNEHGLRVPEDFPADFMEAARLAVDYLKGLPEDHPTLKAINVARVNKGYELLRDGKVDIFYAGKEYAQC